MNFNQLVACCFNVRDQAHYLHLGSHTLGHHLALGTFYEDLTELLDELVEVWQGTSMQLIDTKPPRTRCPDFTDPLELLNWFFDTLAAERYEAIPDQQTHLQNILDEVVSVTARARTKIKFYR